MIIEYIIRTLKAAELVCVMSSNEDGIRVIRYAASIIDKLAPQVFFCPFLLLLLLFI